MHAKIGSLFFLIFAINLWVGYKTTSSTQFLFSKNIAAQSSQVCSLENNTCPGDQVCILTKNSSSVSQASGRCQKIKTFVPSPRHSSISVPKSLSCDSPCDPNNQYEICATPLTCLKGGTSIPANIREKYGSYFCLDSRWPFYGKNCQPNPTPSSSPTPTVSFSPILVTLKKLSDTKNQIGFLKDLLLPDISKAQLIEIKSLEDFKNSLVFWKSDNPKIIFLHTALDFKSYLSNRISIGSNTILISPAQISQSNISLDIRGKSNIVIAGIGFAGQGKGQFDDCRHDKSLNEYCPDAINIESSKNIWIYKNTFEKYEDGLIDLKTNNEKIAITHNIFTNHNKAILIGSSNLTPIDQKQHVLLFQNVFSAIDQRTPRLRFGRVDFVNNLVKNWSRSAIQISCGGKINIENNFFWQDHSSKAVKNIIFNDDLECGNGEFWLKDNQANLETIQSSLAGAKFTGVKMSIQAFIRDYQLIISPALEIQKLEETIKNISLK